MNFLSILSFRAIFFFLVSYGIFIFSYTFFIPPEGTDFFQYYNMSLHPLDYDVAKSPFIYRQFSALVSFSILSLDLSWDVGSHFVDPNIDIQVFFSMLISDYLALFLTALVVSLIIDIEIGKTTITIPLVGGLLCYLAFGASHYVLTGLVEGWTWFFIALGYYAFRKGNIFLFFHD